MCWRWMMRRASVRYASAVMSPVHFSRPPAESSRRWFDSTLFCVPRTRFTARRKRPRICVSFLVPVPHSGVPGPNQPLLWLTTGSRSQSSPSPTTPATSRRGRSLLSPWQRKPAYKSRNIGSSRWAAKVSPSSRALIVREKSASPLSLRPAYWGCPKGNWAPTPCWLMASANSATTWPATSVNYGVASSSRCSPATTTTISAIMVSSCTNRDAGHSRRPMTSTRCRKWTVPA